MEPFSCRLGLQTVSRNVTKKDLQYMRYTVQPAFTCSKLTIETLANGVVLVSLLLTLNGVVLVSLLLILNTFHTLF